MEIAVVGAGSWGTALAKTLADKAGQEVTLPFEASWTRGSESVNKSNASRDRRSGQRDAHRTHQ